MSNKVVVYVHTRMYATATPTIKYYNMDSISLPCHAMHWEHFWDTSYSIGYVQKKEPTVHELSSCAKKRVGSNGITSSVEETFTGQLKDDFLI